MRKDKGAYGALVFICSLQSIGEGDFVTIDWRPDFAHWPSHDIRLRRQR